MIRQLGRATSKAGMKDLRREHWSRVIKEETSALREQWEKAFSGKQMDNVRKRGSCCFNHGSRSGQGAQSSSSTFRAPTQTDGRKPCRCGSPTFRDAWDLAKDVYKLKNEKTDTFYSPAEARVLPAPSSENPEDREFVIDSGASLHMLSRRDLSSGGLETLRRSRNPLWWLRPMEKCRRMRTHRYTFTIFISS